MSPVSLATAAFVGIARKGPRDKPRMVESLAGFETTFGKVDPTRPLSLAVSLFFRNGGRRALVVRVTASAGAAAATARAIAGNGSTGTGMYSLAGAEPFGLLLTPDAENLGRAAVRQLARRAVAFCEAQRALYMLETPPGRPGSELKEAVAWAQRSSGLRSPDAVAYGPAVRIPDPSSRGGSLVLSPNGAIAGLIAKTDRDRGVWKAPAGTASVLQGVLGLAVSPTEHWSRKLAAAGINPLREQAGDCLVWGARTFAATDDREWRYLPVRRLAHLVTTSLHHGLAWTRAHPSDEALWARIRQAASAFLLELYRAGAFPGAKTTEAYFVRCDATTTTAADRSDGIARLTVGLAPLRPAEFVVLELGLSAQPNGGRCNVPSRQAGALNDGERQAD